MEMEKDFIYENLDESPFLQSSLATRESQESTAQLWMSLTLIFQGLKQKFLIAFWSGGNALCVCEETCEIRQCQCGGSGSSHWSHAAQEVRSYREWKLRVPVFLSKSSLTKEHERPTCHLISQTARKNS